LRTDGKVIGWGRNQSGECDIPIFEEPVVFLEAGFSRSAALTASGAFFNWGQNPYGAGDTPDSNVGFIDVGSGYLHNLLLRDNGVILSQGLSYHGGEVLPEPNSGWVDIAAYDEQSVGLKEDGTVWLWGTFDDTIPAHDPAFVKIEAGPGQAFVLDAAGTVHHFGYDYEGSSQLPEPNSGFIDISSGDGHVLALKHDGSIVAWGWNHHGQADPPAESGFTDVEAGYWFGLARRPDGTVAMWGNNTNAELGLRPPATDLVDVGTGQDFGIALRSDGSIAIRSLSDNGLHDIPEPNSGIIAMDAGSLGVAILRGNEASPAPEGGSLPAWVSVVLDAYPNPFNPQTRITVQAMDDGEVSLDVVDMRGRRVRSLWRGNLAAGDTRSIVWDGTDRTGRAMSSGTYFLRAIGPAGHAAVRKVALVR
jgi:alpha-tubulin suppressor-like RCC1 family protein